MSRAQIVLEELLDNVEQLEQASKSNLARGRPSSVLRLRRDLERLKQGSDLWSARTRKRKEGQIFLAIISYYSHLLK